eukprot:COSAG06_NODE_9782_length_1819_cov_1.097093_2_plen_165_part_00
MHAARALPLPRSASSVPLSHQVPLCASDHWPGGGGGTAAQDQEEEEQQLSSLDELERDCLLNCAAASLQLEEPASAAACCDAAVAIDPAHPKAFYRRGQAYAALGKRKRALSDYERAAGLAPKNAAIQKAYRAAKQEALSRMEEKQMLRQQQQQAAAAAAGGAE